MYNTLKQDLQILKDEVGQNRWLLRLEELLKKNDYNSWQERRRVVDRIDETLKDNSCWRNIRTAYGLHGKNNY